MNNGSFVTDDLAIASFLLMKGAKFTGSKPHSHNTNKVLFFFEDDDKCNAIVLEYPVSESSRFESSRRTLRKMLNNAKGGS